MTRPHNRTVSCPNCQFPVPTEQPFNVWLRAQPELDSRKDYVAVTDADLIIHKYATRQDEYGKDRTKQYLMQVEVKTFGALPNRSQRETLTLHQATTQTVNGKVERNSDGRFAPSHINNYRRHVASDGSEVLNYGIKLLVLSNSTPENSSWMRWQGQEIDTETLIAVLRFDLNPDSLRPMNDKHKKKRKRQLFLF